MASEKDRAAVRRRPWRISSCSSSSAFSRGIQNFLREIGGCYVMERIYSSHFGRLPETDGDFMNIEGPEHETASTTNDWEARRRIHALVLLVATFGGIYICYLLVLPFLSALTWALVLAVLFASVHQLIEERLRRPNFSATLSVLIVALIVVVPTTFVCRASHW